MPTARESPLPLWERVRVRGKDASRRATLRHIPTPNTNDVTLTSILSHQGRGGPHVRPASRRLAARGAVLLLALVAALNAKPLLAHGFGGRYDLPVPLGYFLAGAAATVALSFVVIGLFVGRGSTAADYPRLNLLRMGWLRAALAGGVPLAAIRGVSAGLFVLVVAAALLGNQRPMDNLSPAFVWIIWWVGMGYVAALLGNLWMLVNPWKISYEWGEALLARLGGSRSGPAGREGGLIPYPEGWDVWPALALFLAFAWIENVYSGAADPFRLGLLILLYSIVTWSGMALFGKHAWLRHGEAFSVLFGLFSRFSPTEVGVSDAGTCRRCPADCADGGRCVDCCQCLEEAPWEERELSLRPYAVGLARPQKVSAALMVFTVAALATVTFDGIEETRAWGDVQTAVFPSLSYVFGHGTLDVINTAGLLAVPLVFLAVYLAFVGAVKALSGESASAPELASRFVLSLVPIALAYNLAHFLTLLAIQGQLIVPLASDPFGFGWDLFGTAEYQPKVDVLTAKFVWFMSIAAIVTGHVVAVYVSHAITLRESPRGGALVGQLPMVALMVAYTATSLWIIAQPLAG